MDMCCTCGGGHWFSSAESESEETVDELPFGDVLVPGEQEEVPSDYEVIDYDGPLTMSDDDNIPDLDGEPVTTDGPAEAWSAEMGLLALGLINQFRVNPSTLPPTAEGANAPYNQGDEDSPGYDYEWAPQLFELAKEHSLNQANLGELSHDGASERFDRVTFCQVESWGENVAYNMESNEADAVASAI